MCLFITQIAFWVNYKYFWLKLKSIYIKLLTLISFAVIGYFQNDLLQFVGKYVPFLYGYYRLPFKIDTAFTSIVFFGIGVLIKEYEFINVIMKKKITWLLFFGFISIVVIRYNGCVNICALIYNNPILYYIGSLSGSFIVLQISKLISRNSLLEFYGKTLCIHFFLYLYAYILTQIYEYPTYIMQNITYIDSIIGLCFVAILLALTDLIYKKL